MADVTVVTPTFQRRADMGHLARCQASVAAQTLRVHRHAIWNDADGIGAARARQRAFETVSTEWTAFLDDDDWMEPNHLSRLLATANETGADLVYPAFSCTANWTVLDPYHFRPFDADLEKVLREGDTESGVQNFIPITVLVKTELVQQVGGIPLPPLEANLVHTGEDHMLWLALLDIGATFVHLPERTWTYNHHQDLARNTSGRPWKQVIGS